MARLSAQHPRRTTISKPLAWHAIGSLVLLAPLALPACGVLDTGESEEATTTGFFGIGDEKVGNRFSAVIQDAWTSWDQAYRALNSTHVSVRSDMLTREFENIQDVSFPGRQDSSGVYWPVCMEDKDCGKNRYCVPSSPAESPLGLVFGKCVTAGSLPPGSPCTEYGTGFHEDGNWLTRGDRKGVRLCANHGRCKRVPDTVYWVSDLEYEEDTWENSTGSHDVMQLYRECVIDDGGKSQPSAPTEEVISLLPSQGHYSRICPGQCDLETHYCRINLAAGAGRRDYDAECVERSVLSRNADYGTNGTYCNGEYALQTWDRNDRCDYWRFCSKRDGWYDAAPMDDAGPDTTYSWTGDKKDWLPSDWFDHFKVLQEAAQCSGGDGHEVTTQVDYVGPVVMCTMTRAWDPSAVHQKFDELSRQGSYSFEGECDDDSPWCTYTVKDSLGGRNKRWVVYFERLVGRDRVYLFSSEQGDEAELKARLFGAFDLANPRDYRNPCE